MTHSALALLSLVACIISGECGGVLPEAAPYIAECVMTRYAQGDALADIRCAFHGTANRALGYAVPVAWDAIAQGGDPGGLAFALSAADRQRLRIAARPDRVVSRGRWSIAFYRTLEGATW